VGQPARREGTSKGKTASNKSKGKKKDKGKTPRGEGGATAQPEKKEASVRKEEGRVTSQPGKQAGAASPDPLIDPETKGGGLQGRDQPEARPGARPKTTSRGECSRQDKAGFLKSS
jgi:hypothetical protein